jgi:hypothetical protein
MAFLLVQIILYIQPKITLMKVDLDFNLNEDYMRLAVDELKNKLSKKYI